MLMPKKVKHRKQMRGRMTGVATRGSEISFGEYGLKCLEPAWITDRQIEAARGAAAAPPRLRPLLSASFAGFASAVSAVALPCGSGRASLLNEIVT